MTTPTIHTGDDAGQQVFKPVPTEDDVRVLQDRVRQLQYGRGRLLVLSIFLSGVLLAGAVGAAFFYTHMTKQLEDANVGHDAQIGSLLQKDRQIAALNAKIQDQQEIIGSYADFQSIAALEAQIAMLEREIAAQLAQPSRANAPARLKRLPDDVEWLDDAVSALRKQRDALQNLKAEVEAWPPTVQNPRPD